MREAGGKRQETGNTKKVFVLPVSCFLLLVFFVACGTLEDGTDNGNTDSDAAAAETAVDGMIASSNDALGVANEDAAAQALALEQGLSISADPLIGFKELSFSGSQVGTSGSFSWSGTLGEEENFNSDFSLVFTNYQASGSSVVLDGSMAVSVSESATGCTGAWNFSELDVESASNALTMETESLGITLSGPDCDNLSLDGAITVSGDLSVSCDVSGSIDNPTIACQ